MIDVNPGEELEIGLPHGSPQKLRVWRGSGPFVILALHGIADNARWFGALGPELARLGITLLAVDRAGSGRDPRPRGDSPMIDAWLDELTELSARVASAAGLFVLGHSWGAKRLVVALHERMIPVRAALLVAPLVFLAEDLVPPERWDTSPRAGTEPRFAVQLPDERLTADPSVQAFITSDSSRLGHVSASFLIEDARLSRRIDAMQSPLPVPAWLALGGDDRVVDADPTRRWFERLSPGWPSCTIERAGHLVTLERAEELADRIARFLGAVT